MSCKGLEQLFYFEEDKMICFLLFCCLAGGCLGLEVRQSASDLIKQPGDKVQIFCSHEKTDYRVMLWYQRPPGDTAMKLIGYLNFKDAKMEEKYKVDFDITGDLGGNTAKNGSLIVKLERQNHSAVYYCAATGTDTTNPAYFGQGTKLTVLEVGKEITGPTVKVLQPSPKECKNEKDQIRKKTLVCVATEFYPDHVSVYWQISGENITDGVATDEAAQWIPGEKFYQITSRLRVPAEEWENSDNKFQCIVNFFNGSATVPYSDSIYGEASTTANKMTREKYLKITQTAKLTYGVFIAKSCIYGAFVLFLVWKLQGSKGKQKY